MEDSRNLLFYLPYSPYISTHIYEIVSIYIYIYIYQLIYMRSWLCSHSNMSDTYIVSNLSSSYHSDYVRHNNIALKAPTQKMPSAFQVFRKSSKLPLNFMKLQSYSIFWSLQNLLIKSRLRVPALRYYSPYFSKHSFGMPIAISSSSSKFEDDAISGYGPIIVFVNEISYWSSIATLP